ncbi:MAG: hypothetical protein KBF65_08490 [Rubrivivax sp.]|jgi:glutathione S-transferase|nr:hypothetical protein [Betaproteobacteria bacterium]MBP6316983.1 hypothetical protein [Rubrivivax sp.]MBK7277501.1 hypothetical protein [Betaproteobacteria bacterium]MBK7460266.1 hypothetical protein [Betaproteobacteria bacterium]MBK7516182.1 hypothetical protein [Betaproteobacteria bacterium]
MKLIGMLDSPSVRHVAIWLQALGPRFENEPVPAFRGCAAFERISPVVRAVGLALEAELARRPPAR